ncbi:MAG: HD domain-containing protein [Candidatus Omnitrophica bacterium]|nr:HD domain-containing protein [Candidatus Omnitrophota bacterium]
MTGFDYQEALKNASRSMVRVKNPRRLLKMITRFIDREVGVTHSSVLMYDHTRGRYIFVDSKGGLKFPVNLVKLDQDNPLIRWFHERELGSLVSRDFVSKAQLFGWLHNDHLLSQDPNLMERLLGVQEALEILRASVCVPGYYKSDLVGILILGEKLNKKDFDIQELTFFQTLANDAAMAIKTAEFQDDLVAQNRELKDKHSELEHLVGELEEMRRKERRSYYEIVLSLAREVDEKDHYTYGHVEEVERLGLLTARSLGLNLEGRRHDILAAGLKLHDVGKIGIPDEILKKCGKLTEAEYLVMKEHPRKGARILEPLANFEEVAKIVLHHQEKFDGTGYPYGLKGEEIPIESRIVAVVDAFHAMTSSRPYRKARSIEYAKAELRKYTGTQFDPQVVEAFLSELNQMIREETALNSDVPLDRAS